MGSGFRFRGLEVGGDARGRGRNRSRKALPAAPLKCDVDVFLLIRNRDSGILAAETVKLSVVLVVLEPMLEQIPLAYPRNNYLSDVRANTLSIPSE